MEAERRARVAVSTIFFVNGAVLASWIVHIPAVKAQHGIGDGRLGLVLLSMAAGSVLALPIAGWLIGRVGSRVTTSVAAIGFCVALPLPVISANGEWLALALGLLGACNGILDVSMNAQAVAVEERYRRPIMSSFHALFSLGGVAGAGLGSGAMAVGIGPVLHSTGVTILSGGAVLSVLGELLPATSQGRHPLPVFARPPAALFGLGLLTFCGLLAEGAMADWSAVYLHDALGATPAVAATGFVAFSLAMAAGRLGGDRLARVLGPAALLRASGAMAAAGLCAGLLLASPPAAVIGFGLVGLGLANVIPILFSAAGRMPAMPAGTALAAVATTGYGGYLAGPPMIGLLAESTGLPAALGIVALACVFIAAGPGGLLRPRRRLPYLATS